MYNLSTLTLVALFASVHAARAQDMIAAGTDLELGSPSLAPASASPVRDTGSPDPANDLDPRHRPLHGLYVRAGFGFGGLGNNVIDTDENSDGVNSEGTITGMGMTSEITLGGAVNDAWVLGGGVWNSVVFTTDYTQIRGDTIPRGLQRPESVTLVGFLADWRFAPELGLHAQAALGGAGLASKRFRSNELDGSTLAFGPGVSLGIGADFWLDPNWAVGAMARFTAAALLERENGDDYVHGLVAPSLLMTVAYNE